MAEPAEPSPTTTSAAEFHQLSRELFNAAARNWYLAFVLEVGSGILTGGFGLFQLPGSWDLAVALGGIVLLGVAYALRLRFDAQYDFAETMRRQSVFSEALNWPVTRGQASKWLVTAGDRLHRQVREHPRGADYYATTERPGARRLAEMTIESAFWTRALYRNLLVAAVIFIIFSGGLISVTVLITLTRLFPDSVSDIITRALYAFIPIWLTADLVGWAVKLWRLSDALTQIEGDLEDALRESDLTEMQVVRLVSEYNCQVVTGIPIPNWLFQRWHDEIADLWNSRQRVS